jgi:hypothetical protein
LDQHTLARRRSLGTFIAAQLTIIQMNTMLDAVNASCVLGRPPNRHLSIHLEKLGVDQDIMHSFIRIFLTGPLCV